MPVFSLANYICWVKSVHKSELYMIMSEDEGLLPPTEEEIAQMRQRLAEHDRPLSDVQVQGWTM